MSNFPVYSACDLISTENSESEDIFSDEKTETDSKRKKKAEKNKKDKK